VIIVAVTLAAALIILRKYFIKPMNIIYCNIICYKKCYNDFFIIVISTVVLVLYAVFLYLNCKKRRRGSYNVHKRHSIIRNASRNYFRRSSEHEPGTESTHSSFRDLTSSCDNSTAHCHGGLAELGYGGRMVACAEERPEDIVEIVFRHGDTIQYEADSDPFVMNERREHFNTVGRPVVSATNPFYSHRKDHDSI